jgi:hypothetical protein
VTKNKEPRLTRADVDGFNERRPINVAVIEEVGKTVRWMLVVGAVVAIFHYLAMIMGDFAGKTTTANIVLNMLGSLSFSSAVSWGGTAVALGYGATQRHLKMKTVRNLHSHIRELEERLDPARSSSELSPTGHTNPKDE